MAHVNTGYYGDIVKDPRYPCIDLERKSNGQCLKVADY